MRQNELEVPFGIGNRGWVVDNSEDSDSRVNVLVAATEPTSPFKYLYIKTQSP